MKIVILAFNFWYAGKVANGPGMCLANFVNFFQEVHPDVEIKVFTQLKNMKESLVEVYHIGDTKELSKAIKCADIIHHWSGITDPIVNEIRFANNLGKKVIIGPNVIDTVEFLKEKDYLRKIRFQKVLAVNDRLKFRIAKKHKIDHNKISVFQVGPDPKLWVPSSENDGTILWKGNGNQFVKDVGFAKEIEKRLCNKYLFKFIGYPKPYDYLNHISEAKKSKLMIVTSLSETMCMSMLESWSVGIPSISHPKIYMHGCNYRTGIVTNKTIKDYIEAIEEVMEDDVLYQSLSNGCRQFVLEEFSSEKTIKEYMEIIK